MHPKTVQKHATMVKVSRRRSKDTFFTPGKHITIMIFMASVMMFGVIFLKVHRSEVCFVGNLYTMM